MTIDQFYLKDHDFQVFVNKNCQTYGKSPEYILQTPITRGYFESMQRGGCNEKREDGSADTESAAATGAASACDT